MRLPTSILTPTTVNDNGSRTCTNVLRKAHICTCLRYFDLGVHVSAQHMHRSHTPRFHTSQPGFDMQRSLHNLGCSPPPSRLYVRLSHPALGLPHMHHPSTQPAGLKLPDLVDEASFLWLAVRAPFAGPDPHPNPDLLRILHVRCRCVICRTRNQAQHISGKNLHFRPGITHHSLCGFVISPPHSCTFDVLGVQQFAVVSALDVH
jgi:hypothetical protein